ncbi:MAG: class 1 fructose-bisphosphatase [Gammaproteobacteria bacterium]|nr:class 1 fructose-bisphosphatase [Gammaproteobacteria bacterium]
MSIHPGLKEYLANWTGDSEERIAVSLTIEAIAEACIEISALVARGPLAGELGAEKGDNTDGDTQKALDLIANDLIIEALHDAPVSCLVSEELEEPNTINKGAPLSVATDPLDGSSNIDTNVSVGTIFSILPSGINEGGSNVDDVCSLLQPGTAQLAAGYVIYGPQTALVLTLGDGTMIFTLDPLTGEYRLTSDDVVISPDTNEFAINSSNSRQWDGHIKAYVDDCLEGEDGPHGTNYNMRWIASLVAECHRILSRGGIFLYPGDIRKGYGAGRLRLVYECNPIAFLIEQAGGSATTGIQRVLEIQPQNIHERVPMIFGSLHEVELVDQYYAGLNPYHERPQLFRNRTLLR